MPIDEHYGWYYLIAAKRGGKLGWKDANGNSTNELVIAYGKNHVYWRTPEIEEIPEDIKTGAAKMSNGADISEETARGRILDHLRTRGPMTKTTLFNWCAGQFIGFKSKVIKPCRLAYDDVTKHPERYNVVVTLSKYGAETLTYVNTLPGLGADDGDGNEGDGYDPEDLEND